MSLFIGRLNPETSDQDMEDAFGKFGPMRRCVAIQGKGFGFVEYEEKADAQKALDALNGSDLRGNQIMVDYTREKRPEDRDRPRGCFNCGQMGHFARDCSEPKSMGGPPPRNRSRSPGRNGGGYEPRRYDDRGPPPSRYDRDPPSRYDSGGRPDRYDDRRQPDRYDSRGGDSRGGYGGRDYPPPSRPDDRRGGYESRPRYEDRSRGGYEDRPRGGGGGYGDRGAGRDAPRDYPPRRDEPKRDYSAPAPVRDQDVIMDVPAESTEPKDKAGWGAIAAEKKEESTGNW